MWSHFTFGKVIPTSQAKLPQHTPVNLCNKPQKKQNSQDIPLE